MKLPTLYSKDSHGELRMWEVSLIRDVNFYAVSRYGLIGGTIQESKKMCLVGTAPASSIEQAQGFCKSLWNKQKGKGYTESKDGEPQGIAPRPMLAHLFDKHKHKLVYPVIVQPKLDGFRCICIKDRGAVSCWSRTGKRFETTSIIESTLSQVMSDGDMLDGELYRHNYDFNKLSGSIRNLQEDSSVAQYHIYDFITEDQPQFQRLVGTNRIIALGQQVPNFRNYIQQVLSLPANDEQEVIEFTNSFIDNGYEGSIVRSLMNYYRPKYRSPDMLKVKNFTEEDFKIVDYFDGEGKDEGAVIWQCMTPEGFVFTARPRGSYESRRLLFENADKYIGKWLTVRFPKNPASKSEYGIPRFPVGIRIREEME